MAKKTPAEEAEELRGLVSEAHEAMRDLTRIMREMRALRDEMETLVKTRFEEQMADAVSAGLESYKSSLDKAIGAATDATFARFDTIADELLGEGWRHRKQGDPSLTEMVKKKRDPSRRRS